MIDPSKIGDIATANSDHTLPTVVRKIEDFSYEGKLAVKRALGET